MTDKVLKEHDTCPHCGHNGCYTTFEGGGYYCHSCSAKGGRKALTAADIEEEVVDTIRGITKRVSTKYKVTVGKDSLGEPIRHTYPYPHADKYRWLPKDFSQNSGFTNDHLFGMDKFNASSGKMITITEGELDAMSAYQMLGERWPVVSLPSGSLNKKLLANVHEYLDSYDQIVLCLDNDKTGDAAAIKLANLFPSKVYRVQMTLHKDANEFLTAGHHKEFIFAWHNRERYVPSDIYNTKKQFREILEDKTINDYLPTCIKEFDDLCKGLMRGHLTVITGEEGQGKTEVLRMLEANILLEHKDVPIAILHLEESKSTCLLSLCSYVLEKNLRDPEHGVLDKDIQEAADRLADSGNMFFFELSPEEDPLLIIDKIRYLVEVYGVHYVFIDPIQQLMYGKDSDDTEEQVLSKISVQLERLAVDLNVGIVMTTHVNDDGKTRSSRMIGKSASVRIDLKRDHMNPDPDIRNRTHLSVSKNRPVGPTGYGGTLVFNPDTFILKEDF